MKRRQLTPPVLSPLPPPRGIPTTTPPSNRHGGMVGHLGCADEVFDLLRSLHVWRDDPVGTGIEHLADRVWLGFRHPHHRRNPEPAKDLTVQPGHRVARAAGATVASQGDVRKLETPNPALGFTAVCVHRGAMHCSTVVHRQCRGGGGGVCVRGCGGGGVCVRCSGGGGVCMRGCGGGGVCVRGCGGDGVCVRCSGGGGVCVRGCQPRLTLHIHDSVSRGMATCSVSMKIRSIPDWKENENENRTGRPREKVWGGVGWGWVG